MLNKPRGTTKGFSTFITFIGSLSSVDPVILGQERAVTKGLSTLMALRGFLSSVDVWMLGQVCPLIEGLSTLTALIQLLSSVSPQGLDEGGVPDKSFLTGVTLTVLICLQCGSTGGR